MGERKRRLEARPSLPVLAPPKAIPAATLIRLGEEARLSPADRLEAARAEVARLERIAVTATCREAGCDMQHYGGRNCGCEGGSCSVPVYVCTRCGDSDYGENAEATAKRAECDEREAAFADPITGIAARRRDFQSQIPL